MVQAKSYLWRWIGSLLQNHPTRVRVNNTLSVPVTLTCGVPKGSVLGPILFIVAMDSPSARPNHIPHPHHGFFVHDLPLSPPQGVTVESFCEAAPSQELLNFLFLFVGPKQNRGAASALQRAKTPGTPPKCGTRGRRKKGLAKKKKI